MSKRKMRKRRKEREKDKKALTAIGGTFMAMIVIAFVVRACM